MQAIARITVAGLVLGTLLVAWPGPAAAQSAQRKVGRGLANMTCGFLELPGNMVREGRKSGPPGVALGFAKGLGGIVVRELVGVYEFVTSPFPWPAGYKPMIEPEFPWGYFEEGGGGRK
jgi:putative exosortase-associated protein (TIGR04073 family)